MAKATLRNTGKFKALAQRLRLPSNSFVQGLLEALWDSAHARISPLVGDMDSIEAAAEWPYDRGVFARAVIEIGFVDEIVPNLYAVHDYYDHAPEWVKKRLSRRVQEDASVSPETCWLPREVFARLVALAGGPQTADNGAVVSRAADNGADFSRTADNVRHEGEGGSQQPAAADNGAVVRLSSQGKARLETLTPVAPALSTGAVAVDLATQPPDPDLALATGRVARLVAELERLRPAAAHAIDEMTADATTPAEWTQLALLAESELAAARTALTPAVAS